MRGVRLKSFLCHNRQMSSLVTADPRRASAPTITILWVIWMLFCLRVVGQAVVARWAPQWLPPMEAWYSGLIAYPYLLVSQVLIVFLLVRVCCDLTRNQGFFAKPRSVFHRPILVFGWTYLGAMILRYFIRMTMFPDQRWTGGCIPIFMHWGLASFLLLFARNAGRALSASRGPGTS